MSFDGIAALLKAPRRLFALAMLVMLLSLAITPSGPALAQTDGQVPGQSLGQESDSDIWRRLRQGESMMITDPMTGPAVIIQSEGDSWRALRNGPLSYYGGWLLVVAVVGVALFFLIRGRVKIAGGRSGRWIPRFTNAERVIHWYVASLFVMLALTGLTLMFGRYVVKPIIGPEAFGVLASAFMQAHNLLGPLFIIGVLAMLVVYIKDNFPTWIDIVWVFKGGMFFAHNAPSGKFNLGEKAWFWIAMVCGIALSISGLLLDFPAYAGQVAAFIGIQVDDRTLLQFSHLVHGAAALLAIAPALGHIYLGTVGVEGALEGMTAGHVDENWAKEHHDKWAEEVMAKMTDASPGEAASTPAPAE